MSTDLVITDGGTGRRVVDDDELLALVDAEITSNVMAAKAFTAYDVTLALRAAHPDLEIVHDDVRDLVVVEAANRGCDVSMADYDGTPARLYSPPGLTLIASPPDDDDDDGDGGSTGNVQKLLPASSGDSGSSLLPGIDPV